MIIAIPQNKKMEYEYKFGYKIEIKFIKKNNLKFDELFDTYVNNPNKTKYIIVEDTTYIELQDYGILDKLNNIANIYIDLEIESDISNKYLSEVVEYLKKEKREFSKKTKEVIKKIILLVEGAIEIGVGIYFMPN